MVNICVTAIKRSFINIVIPSDEPEGVYLGTKVLTIHRALKYTPLDLNYLITELFR
jgi:hypothetical protein